MTISQALKILTLHPDFEEFKVDSVIDDNDKVEFRAHIYEADGFTFTAKTAEEAIIKLAVEVQKP